MINPQFLNVPSSEILCCLSQLDSSFSIASFTFVPACLSITQIIEQCAHSTCYWGDFNEINTATTPESKYAPHHCKRHVNFNTRDAYIALRLSA